jgi:multicomponent Na+:H+ antiporter subunit E
VGQTLRFLVWFLWELFLSNVRVAYDVATPGHLAKPGILAIPLDAETPFEITLFANLITLTPGTLSLDVSSDNKTLYIHAMYIDDPDTLRREIKEGLEKRLLELLR